MTADSDLANDILNGAADIAEFLFGDRTEKSCKRVYHLIEKRRLPIFRFDDRGPIHARKPASKVTRAGENAPACRPGSVNCNE